MWSYSCKAESWYLWVSLLVRSSSQFVWVNQLKHVMSPIVPTTTSLPIPNLGGWTPPHPPFESFQELLHGCFPKWWYPQKHHFNRVFHYKPSILGYPVPLFLETSIYWLWKAWSADKEEILPILTAGLSSSFRAVKPRTLSSKYWRFRTIHISMKQHWTYLDQLNLDQTF